MRKQATEESYRLIFWNFRRFSLRNWFLSHFTFKMRFKSRSSRFFILVSTFKFLISDLLVRVTSETLFSLFLWLSYSLYLSLTQTHTLAHSRLPYFSFLFSEPLSIPLVCFYYSWFLFLFFLYPYLSFLQSFFFQSQDSFLPISFSHILFHSICRLYVYLWITPFTSTSSFLIYL